MQADRAGSEMSLPGQNWYLGGIEILNLQGFLIGGGHHCLKHRAVCRKAGGSLSWRAADMSSCWSESDR